MFLLSGCDTQSEGIIEKGGLEIVRKGKKEEMTKRGKKII